MSLCEMRYINKFSSYIYYDKLYLSYDYNARSTQSNSTVNHPVLATTSVSDFSYMNFYYIYKVLSLNICECVHCNYINTILLLYLLL